MEVVSPEIDARLPADRFNTDSRVENAFMENLETTEEPRVLEMVHESILVDEADLEVAPVIDIDRTSEKL